MSEKSRYRSKAAVEIGLIAIMFIMMLAVLGIFYVLSYINIIQFERNVAINIKIHDSESSLISLLRSSDSHSLLTEKFGVLPAESSAKEEIREIIQDMGNGYDIKFFSEGKQLLYLSSGNAPSDFKTFQSDVALPGATMGSERGNLRLVVW